MRSRRLPPGDQKRPGAVSFDTYLGWPVGTRWVWVPGGYAAGFRLGFLGISQVGRFLLGFLLGANRFLKSLRPMACRFEPILDDLKFGPLGSFLDFCFFWFLFFCFFVFLFKGRPTGHRSPLHGSISDLELCASAEGWGAAFLRVGADSTGRRDDGQRPIPLGPAMVRGAADALTLSGL